MASSAGLKMDVVGKGVRMPKSLVLCDLREKRRRL